MLISWNLGSRNGDCYRLRAYTRTSVLDYLYKEVDGEFVRDDEIWKKWESGFGGIAEEAVQYKDNLLQRKEIVLDYGVHDENA